MKALILEDDKTRMIYFRRVFKNYEIYHVEHAQDAINLLKEHQFDVICLDHDLGDQQMKWDPEDCGMNVAEYLRDNPDKITKTLVIIHSFNTPRALIMKSLIPKSVFMPGFWLKGQSDVQQNK